MSFVTLVLFVFLAVIPTIGHTEVSKPMRFSVFWPCAGNASFCAPRILAEGTIEQDSHRKFTTFLSNKKTHRHDLPPKPTVCFNSPGGDLSGAIELGRTIRKLQLDTCLSPEYSQVIEGSGGDQEVFVKNVLCASACTFAFAGGLNREIDEGSRIGIHQFFGARKPVGDSVTQLTIVVLAAYLEEMGVSRNLLDIASVIPPNKLYWLNKTEMQSSKIDNMSTELAEWKLDTTEDGLVFAHVVQEKPGTHSQVGLYITTKEYAPTLFVSFHPQNPTTHKLEAAKEALNSTRMLSNDIHLIVDGKAVSSYKRPIWSAVGDNAVATSLPLSKQVIQFLKDGIRLEVWVIVANVDSEHDPSLEFTLNGLSRLLSAVIK